MADSKFTIDRNPTRKIAVGDRFIGGDAPIAVQSMTATKTTDIDATVQQINDLVNAGAIFEDASVVVDRHFVSSRKPDDLPDFCKAILKVCGKA